MSGDGAHSADADFEFTRGEFGELLAEIEKEAVPERLLELALRLQQALANRRAGVTAATQPAEASL